VIPTEVLIVEDDNAIATGLALNLRIEGYQATIVGDGESALARVKSEEPGLIVLDIGLPKKTGLDVLSELRAAGFQTPIIVLSARQDEFDKVAALRLGADDYVTKPFALAELLARCTAVLRRSSPSRRAPVRPIAAGFADVTIDRVRRRVEKDGDEVTLTHLELELLIWFIDHPGRVFAREELLREVWGASAGSLRTVDNFVAQLRNKLEPEPDSPRHLVTVRGSGYRFDP
jgi:DNA-binding response OmpR family regulator